MTQDNITTMEQLEAIHEASFNAPQLLFKHSTSCNISADAWYELQQSTFHVHYLDLLTYRPISNAIAEKYNVIHKSPQVLVIKDGLCIYNESHWRIKNEELQQYLEH